MPLSVPAIGLIMCLMPLGMARSAPSPAAPSTAPAPTVAPDSDAAIRHAKRTACLKDAKAKKLVGAAKNSFIKACAAGR